jgi:hypothetical protein
MQDNTILHSFDQKSNIKTQKSCIKTPITSMALLLTSNHGQKNSYNCNIINKRCINNISNGIITNDAN